MMKYMYMQWNSKALHNKRIELDKLKEGTIYICDQLNWTIEGPHLLLHTFKSVGIAFDNNIDLVTTMHKSYHHLFNLFMSIWIYDIKDKRVHYIILFALCTFNIFRCAHIIMDKFVCVYNNCTPPPPSTPPFFILGLF